MRTIGRIILSALAALLLLACGRALPELPDRRLKLERSEPQAWGPTAVTEPPDEETDPLSPQDPPDTGPAPTTLVSFAGNLSATSPDPPSSPFDPNSPSTYTNTASVQIFDSLGAAHSLTAYFVHEIVGNAYSWHIVVPVDDQAAPVDATGEIMSGWLTFDGSGALQSAGGWTSAPVSFRFANPNQTIALDFGTSIDEGGDGLRGVTCNASLFSVAATADGHAALDPS